MIYHNLMDHIWPPLFYISLCIEDCKKCVSHPDVPLTSLLNIDNFHNLHWDYLVKAGEGNSVALSDKWQVGV